jgi:hypothetical protein
MVGLFLGAGFSKWSMNLPLVNNLFDFEISNIRSGDEYWFLKLQDEKTKWDSFNPNSNNEEFIFSIITGKKLRIKSYLSKYIARRLSEPFLCNTLGGIQTLMYNDKKVSQISGIAKAKNFFGIIGLKNIYGIITTNYDLIIEYALGTPRFNLGERNEEVKGRGHNPRFPWQHTPVVLSGSIKVAKIHGSIAFDGQDNWSSGVCGLNGQAYFIPPAPEKNVNEMLYRQWDYATEILNNISELIVFGFNFNEYDLAVLNLLKTNSKAIEKVHIHDIESKIKKAEKIWDAEKIIEYRLNETDLDPNKNTALSLF